MPTKPKKTASLHDLVKVLYEQTDLLRTKKVDLNTAKAINQTSNQIMNAYKVQLSAFKMLGKNRNKEIFVNNLLGG